MLAVSRTVTRRARWSCARRQVPFQSIAEIRQKSSWTQESKSSSANTTVDQRPTTTLWGGSQHTFQTRLELRQWTGEQQSGLKDWEMPKARMTNLARDHVLISPLSRTIRVNNVSSLVNCDSQLPLHFITLSHSSRRITSRRYASGSPNKDTSKATDKDSEKETAVTEPYSAESYKEESLRSFPQQQLDRARNNPVVARVEKGIKRVVDDLGVGDQLAVAGIAVFALLLAVSPYMIRQMKNSTRDFDGVIAITEDPVDDFTHLARDEWWGDGEPPLGSSATVESLLNDLVRSQTLQQAAQQFVVQVLESAEVRAALNRLLKELWTDLVTDPETVAQVIHLLQIAIRDEKVKQAAQRLVVDLVQDPEVKQALIEMLQKLGKEKDVQQAVQGLLVHSAHQSLNNPEILEHSMEFATDVLGDDIVQQTAGEALRNTVGHAFRPAATMALTATGVALMIFGVVAIGYARSSDQEVRLFEAAASSLQSNAVYGISRLVSWPFRTLRAVGNAVGRFLQRVGDIMLFFLEKTLAFPGHVVRSITQMLFGGVSSVASAAKYVFVAIGNAFVNTGVACQQAFVSLWVGTVRAISNAVRWCWTGACTAVNNTLTAIERSILKFLAGIENAIVLWWKSLLGR